MDRFVDRGTENCQRHVCFEGVGEEPPVAYCRHGIPADTCALGAPRRPVTIHLIACGDYDEGPHTVGGKVCVHRPDCSSATPHEGAHRPYPRWETTEAEARAHHWHFCQLCKP